MAKVGRKPTYDRPAVMAEVCQIMATSDRSLWSILASDDRFPSERQFFVWLSEDESLQQDYARAKDLQADYLAWQTVAIADDDSEDEMFVESDDASGKSARRVCNNEFVQRSRLRIDARKWLASKLAPKKYGDRITQEHTGDGGGPVVVKIEI